MSLICVAVQHQTLQVGMAMDARVLLASINGHVPPAVGRGVIQVIFGPMFSGKTTELLRRMKRFTIAKHNCLLIKYGKDTRYSTDCVATHDKQASAAHSCHKLMDVANEALAYGVIGIDEGQFFPDVVPFCESMANHGKTVIVAALDGTFQRKPFGEILSLVPLAESVIKLSAVCMHCGADGAFSKRVTAETEVEVIGGSDKYVAVCRECYFERALGTTTETPMVGKPSCASPLTNGPAQRKLFE